MEANYLLSKINWETPFPNIFINDKNLLLITGQGHKNVIFMLNRLMNHLADKKAPTVFINMGVAGAVNPILEKGNVYSIRTAARLDLPAVYHSADRSAHYDCLTTEESIHLGNNVILQNKNFDLVDMELWSIANFAHVLKIPFISLKYISDFVTEKINTNDIRRQAEYASQMLWDTYKSMRTKNDLV